MTSSCFVPKPALPQDVFPDILQDLAQVRDTMNLEEGAAPGKRKRSVAGMQRHRQHDIDRRMAKGKGQYMKNLVIQ